MSNKSKPKETSIYINHDLTKEQPKRDRKLRAIRKRMLQEEEYKGREISIYKGNLYVDRTIVEPSTLQHLSSK